MLVIDILIKVFYVLSLFKTMFFVVFTFNYLGFHNSITTMKSRYFVFSINTLALSI